jgi:hypothetical protein
MKPDTTSAVIKYVTNGWCDSMKQLESNYNPYVVRLVKRFLYEYREINEPEILK